MTRSPGAFGLAGSALLAIAVLLPSVARAGNGESPAAATGTPEDLLETGTPGYYHPAQYFRELGLEAQQEGHYERARGYLLRAARYSDKLSQAVLAEQYWLGQGSPGDRALGYIWMDLAAERGTPSLIALRESYWNQLDDAERQRVREQGPALHAEYADAAARPRLDRELRRQKHNLVGSRTGWDSNVDICNVFDQKQLCRHSTPLEALQARK